MILPSIGVLHGCEYEPKTRLSLTESDIPLLDELGETIIPTTTDVPGAKATNIGAYMLLMYQDCMTGEEQQIFVQGINELDNRSARQYSSSFLNAKDKQKLGLLEMVQAEAVAYNLQNEGMDIVTPHFFDILKGLTLSGYFSSEIGMTVAREYLPLPGKYVACMPYSKSDKVWAI